MKSTASFDYPSIPPGYYDLVFHRGRGIQSKWHRMKFLRIGKEMGEYSAHLDIGCGGGTLIGSLPSGSLSIGADIAQPQISYAQKKYGTQMHMFQPIDPGGHLPFKDNQFDLVTLIEVIEHLSQEEIYSLLGEVHRVLQPGGRILLSTPNYRSLWPLIEWMLNRLGEVSYADQHINHYNYSWLETLLKKAGFVKIKLTAFQGLGPFFALLHWKLADIIAKLEPKILVSRVGLLLLGEGYKGLKV